MFVELSNHRWVNTDLVREIRLRRVPATGAVSAAELHRADGTVELVTDHDDLTALSAWLLSQARRG
jgi:hypothetical protein